MTYIRGFTVGLFVHYFSSTFAWHYHSLDPTHIVHSIDIGVHMCQQFLDDISAGGFSLTCHHEEGLTLLKWKAYIDGLVQERCNSSALAMELHLSCTNPSTTPSAFNSSALTCEHPRNGVIWVDIGSGNGLLPDSTKALPEPMLTYHHSCSVAFIWEQLHKKCSWTWSVFRDYIYKMYNHISQGPKS